MQTTWLGESSFFVYTVSSERIIIGGGFYWRLVETVSVAENVMLASLIQYHLAFLKWTKSRANPGFHTAHTHTYCQTENETRPINTNKDTGMYSSAHEKQVGWCQCHWHVWPDTSWVTRRCLQAGAAVLASYDTAATEDKDGLHVVFIQPLRLLLVLCVWKWECEVAVRRHGRKIKRGGYLQTWHLLEFTLSFFPTNAPA